MKMVALIVQYDKRNCGLLVYVGQIHFRGSYYFNELGAECVFS